MLIPNKGFEVLLAEGPCGASAPMAWRDRRGTWFSHSDRGERPLGEWENALALVWNDQVIDDGMERAKRVLARRDRLDASAGLLWVSQRDGWLLLGGEGGSQLVRMDFDQERHYDPHGPTDEGLVYTVPALRQRPSLTGRVLDAWALGVSAEQRGCWRTVMIATGPGVRS